MRDCTNRCAHLKAAGAADAEQQAADFVERVRTGRTSTPPGNDAQLWGATSVALGTTLSSEDRMIVARQLIAILRRLREPHRRTWAPGDELPTAPPAKIADLDGDVWMHQNAGKGCYRMSSKDRRRNADSIHEYEGPGVAVPARSRGPAHRGHLTLAARSIHVVTSIDRRVGRLGGGRCHGGGSHSMCA